MKIIQHRLFLEENCVDVHLKQGRSIILLNIKCPQQTKPKAKSTVARNQNSGDRMEKTQSGASSPRANEVWFGQHYKSDLNRNIQSIYPFPSVWKSNVMMFKFKIIRMEEDKGRCDWVPYTFIKNVENRKQEMRTIAFTIENYGNTSPLLYSRLCPGPVTNFPKRAATKCEVLFSDL